MEGLTDKQVFTKGDRENVIRRFDMIHTLTMYCPISDKGMKCFRTSLTTLLNTYMENKDLFSLVPTIDVFLCFMETMSYCKENDVNVDVLFSFWGVVSSFKNLKYLNVKFVNDKTVLNSYHYLRGEDKSRSFDAINNIYKVEVIEFVLSNMFDDIIVDMLNKTFAFDDIISNSYLEREFILVFEYDEYIAYMNMFTNNNSIELFKLDPNIVDYLLLFPKIITSHKPNIRILTDYSNI